MCDAVIDVAEQGRQANHYEIERAKASGLNRVAVFMLNGCKGEPFVENDIVPKRDTGRHPLCHIELVSAPRDWFWTAIVEQEDKPQDMLRGLPYPKKNLFHNAFSM